jgi:hypothetical protein
MVYGKNSHKNPKITGFLFVYVIDLFVYLMIDF